MAGWDAVVVGAGPNGLTAAARLARSGRRVLVLEAASTPGGGSRTTPFDDAPDARRDICAAIHPFGVSSPAFEALDLHHHGLRWLHPPVKLAHPFDDGSAATLDADLDDARWHRLVDPLVAAWPELRHLALAAPLTGTARHPIRMGPFSAVAALPAAALARGMASPAASALLVGLAAHSGARLDRPATAGVALALAAAGLSAGMPVAALGSQSIIDALCAVIRECGGQIDTDRRITSIDQVPAAKAVLFDLTPAQTATILGRRAPHWKHGTAAWKLDLVLDGPMPWTAEACWRAGTVHLGGSAADIARVERQTAAGQLPDRPYVIVAQPSVADPTRAPLGQHVLWAYRHVPNGCADPMATQGIEAQFDRFAPGWRDLVVARTVTSAIDYAAYNESYPGGDVAGGAMTTWQTVARPRLALDPYRIRGHAGAWLCSQSTPPGPGVHGMCGWHAAGSVLAHT